MTQFVGAFCVGIVIGWFVYYINRYRKSDLQVSDVTTLIGVFGPGAVTFYGQRPDLFAGYTIGLCIGFFSYFAMLILLVAWSENFDRDWFLDGRRKRPEDPYYIPDGTAITVRPALTAPVAPRVALPLTYRTAPDAGLVGDVDSTKLVRLMAVLKPATPYDTPYHVTGRGLTRWQFRQRHRTNQVAINRVTKFALQHGLTIEQVDPDHHIVKLAGTYEQAQQAFQPDHLGLYRLDGKEFVARGGSLSVPEPIAGDLVAVIGFDQRPVAQPHVRMGARKRAKGRAAAAAAGASYNPAEIAKLYNFPPGDGKGQTIALLEFGGGFVAAQVNAYFVHQGVARTGLLKPIILPDGANVQDNNPTKGDGEVQMDIEIAGSVAPAADISVYFAPNTPNGFCEAVHQAITDNASVISLSWGNPEGTWGDSDRKALDQLFQSAQKEVTICVASGDSGALDNPRSTDPAVDFPASSQNVLACGGTTRPRNGIEVAWQGSGGGYSTVFDIPSYQNLDVGGQHRGVPDVAGNADPDTGYNLEVNGSAIVLGGTSAVAPLWAGLIALINQQLGRSVGLVNVDLYQGSDVTADITAGNNGYYAATSGWDPVTGLGAPNGGQILQALQVSAKLQS
jgi:kumamolisin